ncbi:MAG: NUDIX domain-containing protein [Sandaracinaceae bacterium]|nr:NUDIX domain-containing protein [Sandaracinaceae bacterium]
MPSTSLSAGVLLVRARSGDLEYFLVHPGGPFFRKKDAGVWGIPKGLVAEGEDPFDTARRELVEETGFAIPEGPFVAIGEVTQRSGKRVLGWAVAGDADPKALVSNTFDMIWPPRSGRSQSFPEVDRGDWFGRDAAALKMNPAQLPFLDRAAERRAELGL